MLENKTLYNLISRGAFLLLNLFSFLVFFIPYYVLGIENGDWEYAVVFFNKLSEFSLPAIAAALVFIIHPSVGMKRSIFSALFYALPRAVFLIPYHYLEYTAYGYIFDEALLMSLLVSVFGVLLFFLQTVLLFLLGRAAYAILYSRGVGDKLSLKLPIKERRRVMRSADMALPTEMLRGGAFDLTVPVNLGLFTIGFAEFIIYLIREIYDTVVYVSEASFFMDAEIIYMMVSYVFLLLELLFVHFISCLIKNKVKYKKTNNETAESESI